MRIWSCGWCIVALVVVVWCLCLHKCTSLLFWDKLLFQIYLIVNLLLTLKDYYNVTNTTIVTFIGSDSCVSYQRICHVSTPRWFGWACVDTSIYRQPHCAYSFCGWGVQNGIWAIVPKAPPPFTVRVLTWGPYASKYALHPTVSLWTSHVTQRNGALIHNWDNIL